MISRSWKNDSTWKKKYNLNNISLNYSWHIQTNLYLLINQTNEFKL